MFLLSMRYPLNVSQAGTGQLVISIFWFHQEQDGRINWELVPTPAQNSSRQHSKSGLSDAEMRARGTSRETSFRKVAVEEQQLEDPFSRAHESCQCSH